MASSRVLPGMDGKKVPAFDELDLPNTSQADDRKYSDTCRPAISISERLFTATQHRKRIGRQVTISSTISWQDLA